MSNALPVTRVFSLRKTEYEWREVTVSFSPVVTLRCRVPQRWSGNAANTLMSKYAARTGVPDSLGGVDGREVDAERIFDRLVAGWRAAAIEHGYWLAGDTDLFVFCDEIKAMLEQQVAAPNSPQWFNTGLHKVYGITSEGDGHYYATMNADGHACAHECDDLLSRPQVSACFIQSVADDLVGDGGIMDLWQREARLFKQGSGTGSNFSALRGKNEPLSRGGTSSGLLSFLRVGDRAAGAIKSGGVTRRAAKMVIVDDDHPDIEAFVEWKPREDAKICALRDGGFGAHGSFEDEASETVSGQNANNSVSVGNAFLNAVCNDDNWTLTRRVDGQPAKVVEARELWHKITKAAWQCADPGLQFRDTINAWHTCKNDGPIRSSNPCSEYVFLDDTACNLASLNLARFIDNAENPVARRFNYDKFQHAARLWTIVLDISVSMASYPTAEIARRSMLYRTLGLGYAALGEALVLLGLGYGTEAGQKFAADLTSLLTCTAYRTSTELAEKLGEFPRYRANASSLLAVLAKHKTHNRGSLAVLWDETLALVRKHGVRNAQVTLLAPCGTIGIVMDCETAGVEPYYSDNTTKTLAGGGTMSFVSQRFQDTLRQHGHDPEDYTRRCWTVEDGVVHEYAWIEPPDTLANVLVCASTLTPRQHIDMMVAVQPFLSGAISKTINMPSTATVEDVADLYMYAWRQGLKSIAIYRDGCKPDQPLRGRQPAPHVRRFAAREQAELSAQLRQVLDTPVERFVAAVAESAPGERERMRIGIDTPVMSADVRFTFDGNPMTGAGIVTVSRLARGERHEPPASASGTKHRITLSGHTFYLHLYEHADGSLAEVFVTCSRTGSAIAGWVNSWAKLFSLALQHGTPLAVLVDAMQGETFDPSGYHDARPVASAVDCFARVIRQRYLAEPAAGPQPTAQTTPVAEPTTKPTGHVCDACGSADLRRSGTCYVCGRCGATTGCS